MSTTRAAIFVDEVRPPVHVHEGTGASERMEDSDWQEECGLEEVRDDDEAPDDGVNATHDDIPVAIQHLWKRRVMLERQGFVDSFVMNWDGLIEAVNQGEPDNTLQALFSKINFQGKDKTKRGNHCVPLQWFKNGWVPPHNLQPGEHLISINVEKMEWVCTLAGCGKSCCGTKKSTTTDELVKHMCSAGHIGSPSGTAAQHRKSSLLKAREELRLQREQGISMEQVARSQGNLDALPDLLIKLVSVSMCAHGSFSFTSVLCGARLGTVSLRWLVTEIVCPGTRQSWATLTPFSRLLVQ
jgi:hypothetical protein